MAFVETATREGNGVLIEGGYIVTNAQVVWPFQEADVVFADGSEFPDVPVRGLDLQTDLAVLGPIDSPADGLKLVDGESTPKYANVFIVGYPAKPEEFGQPSVESRLLLGIGRFGAAGIMYLHTEAQLPADGAAASHFSGWVLVSERGDVIGVLGRRPRATAYEIAASSADILRTVQKLIAGGNSSRLGDRRIPLDGGETRHENTLEHFVAERVYVINEPPGTEINLELTGELAGYFVVKDSDGRRLLVSSKDENEAASDSLVVEGREPLFVVVHRYPVVVPQYPMAQGDFTLKSSHPLKYHHDPDDGRMIQVGDTVYGNIDFPGDWDYFLLDLSKGETVEATNTSPVLDLVLTFYALDRDGQIDFGAVDTELLHVGDSSTVYRAPRTGSYLLWAYRDSWGAPSGYVITVEAADPDAELTQRTRADVIREANATPSPTTDSEFGLAELKSAFADLPDSFQELDPERADISIESLGLKDFATSLVLFNNTEPVQPVQIVIAASGELTDLLSIALDSVWSPDTVLDEIVQAQISEVLDSGKLQTVTVGDNSFGVYLETASERGPQRMELIMYRRGNLFGAIYSYTVAGTEPVVSVEELAMMLDTKMVDFLRTRDP